MPLTVSRGNMYPWVTHCHGHLRGGCPHDCVYCYVKSFRNPAPFQGPIRLAEKELRVNYYRPWTDGEGMEHPNGRGKTIFIEHCNDLFAEGVPDVFIGRIINHTALYENGNAYLFQTKNPERMWDWYDMMPGGCIFGTTIETNYDITCWMKDGKQFTLAPPPEERYHAMLKFAGARRAATDERVMVTVEPILDFDVEELSRWIIDIRPDFINIGADSKHHGLPEPAPWKVEELIDVLAENGIVINKKTNLGRLMGSKLGCP